MVTDQRTSQVYAYALKWPADFGYPNCEKIILIVDNLMWNVVIPIQPLVYHWSRLTVRNFKAGVGTGTTKKLKLLADKATGIHNRADRVK
jgi:hypothetical protein